MTTIVVVEAFALGLLALLVAGLLRSHAEILRVLHDLGVTEEGAGAAGNTPRSEPGVVAPRGDPRPAADLAGVSPEGAALHVSVAGTAHQTLLVFLSSGCTGCSALWTELKTLAPSGGIGGSRVVVVTRGPEEESPGTVAELAPAGVTAVMSSAAFAYYGVTGTPFFALVDGPSGRVVGEGSALRLHQIDAFVQRAAADARVTATRGGFDARRRDTDAELVAAGILPGDPRLHHGHAGGRR